MNDPKGSNIESKPRDEGKVGFLSLPREIRRTIYRLELLQAEPIVLKLLDLGQYPDSDLRRKRFQPNVIKPPLLRTCREIYYEARTVQYVENTFYFSHETLSGNAIQGFSDTVGKSIEMFQRFGVTRSFQIGNGKPVEISFEVKINEKLHPVIVRPENEHTRFPGWRAKMRGPDYEPCRCEVAELADSFCSGRYTCGIDLIWFLQEYVKVIKTPATQQEIEVCKKCSHCRRP